MEVLPSASLEGGSSYDALVTRRGSTCLPGALCRSRNEAKADVFDHIGRFYNPKRRHSTIGYLSPMEFER